MTVAFSTENFDVAAAITLVLTEGGSSAPLHTIEAGQMVISIP